MLGWIVAGLTLLWSIYQHFHPRVLQRAEYSVSLSKKRYHLVGIEYKSALEDHAALERRANLTGVELSIRSTGGRAITGLLVHMRLSRKIEHQEICTDEEYRINKGKGTEEIQVKVPNLNPTDVVTVTVYGIEERGNESIEDILVNYRVTLSEGIAKRVNKS